MPSMIRSEATRLRSPEQCATKLHMSHIFLTNQKKSDLPNYQYSVKCHSAQISRENQVQFFLYLEPDEVDDSPLQSQLLGP